MNVEQLEASGHIILSVTAGSHMYGLNVEGSDEDTRGIFDLPIEKYIFPDHPKQVADDTNDTVYYEVVRFLDLARQANPNILEILFAPERSVIIKDPKADIILKHRDKFLTKAARQSLGGYAVSQIKKARGQNKKIVNPVTERKDVLDFCYIITPIGAKPLKDWLHTQRGMMFDQTYYGASVIDHARDLYFIYPDTPERKYGFKGLVKLSEEGGESNELRLSSIPKECMMMGEVMTFNKDGYTSHCKDYKEYQDWVKKRNKERYANNLKHGQGYDAKNLMHCFRLLNMGIELAKEGTLNVFRKDRDFLLKIRRGEYTYDELIEKADGLVIELDEAFEKSKLPTSVSDKLINT